MRHCIFITVMTLTSAESTLANSCPLSVLWISRNHDSAARGSILNTGGQGYSGVAALAEQLGASNVEVDDSTPITSELLAPHALVILGENSSGAIPTPAEVDALLGYVAGGGKLLVMCGGGGTAGGYANSVSQPLGVTFAATPTGDAGYADAFLPDLLTENVIALYLDGPNYITTENPAILLGTYNGNGMLARSDYGAGSAAFWADEWVFFNSQLDDASNRQFAENVFRFAGIPQTARLLAHDPSTPDDVVRTPGPIESVRLIWSEAVSVDPNDVEITDSSGLPVAFSVSGSDTQVTTLDLDPNQPLLGDTFTFTVHDTAVATANNAPIDGDDDGVAGGDAVFMLTHCCLTDLDCDGETGLSDLAELLARYGQTCP